MRKLISILSPVYWTTAKEIGEAMNGFTLTDAVFKRETQVEFATGEFPALSVSGKPDRCWISEKTAEDHR